MHFGLLFALFVGAHAFSNDELLLLADYLNTNCGTTVDSTSVCGNVTGKYVLDCTENFLDIFSGCISGETVAIFPQLHSLLALRLLGTHFSSLPPNVFDMLPNLVALRLLKGQLSSLPPNVFDKLPNLHTLEIYENQLLELPPKVFDSLSKLTLLNLGNNQLSNLVPGVFDNMPNMFALGLYANRFTSFPVGVFDKLANLSLLTLSTNELNKLHPNTFDKLQNLMGMTMKGNNLSYLESNIFANLPSMIWLDLSENQLCGTYFVTNKTNTSLPEKCTKDGSTITCAPCYTYDFNGTKYTLIHDLFVAAQRQKVILNLPLLNSSVTDYTLEKFTCPSNTIYRSQLLYYPNIDGNNPELLPSNNDFSSDPWWLTPGTNIHCETCKLGSEIQNNTCMQCSGNTYRDIYSSACISCPPDSLASDDHISCIACPPGQYNDDNSTSCSPCPRGSMCPQVQELPRMPMPRFGDVSNAFINMVYLCITNYKDFVTQCDNIFVPPYLTNGNGIIAALKASHPTASDITVLTPCPNGTYQNDTMQTFCLPCPMYSISTYDRTGCQCNSFNQRPGVTFRNYSDIQCGCEAGYGLINNGTVSSCQPCPDKTYSGDWSQVQCQPCAGLVWNSRTQCIICDTPGSKPDCTCLCPSGYYDTKLGKCLTLSNLRTWNDVLDFATKVRMQAPTNSGISQCGVADTPWWNIVGKFAQDLAVALNISIKS